MRIAALFLAIGLVLAGLAGCDRDPSQAPVRSSGPAPALWEVRGPEGKVEGWLFGTIHSLPDGVDWRTRRLRDTLAEADMLVVEVAGLDDGKELSKLFENMAFDAPAGPIAARIDPSLGDEFEALLVKAKVRRSYFDPMESWAAALALAQVAQPGTSDNGVDVALLADFGKREVVELEGARNQLAIFDTLPAAQQTTLLETVLAESAGSDAEMLALARAWQSGDVKTMEQLTRKGILADPGLKEALLVRRNRDWAARIENLLSARPRPFVAVGAGHLLGPEGLPAELATRGYRVKRIQ